VGFAVRPWNAFTSIYISFPKFRRVTVLAHIQRKPWHIGTSPQNDRMNLTKKIGTLVEKNGFIFPIILYAILLIYISLRSYLNINFTVVIGFLLLPYVWSSNLENRTSNRWLVVVILLSIACWYLSIMTLFYWLAVMGLIFAFESLRSRLTILPIALLFTISMIFRYLSEVFTFPIRIWLSACVGSLLKFCQFDIKISGNNIVLNGSDFSIEPACMGLDMIGISLMMSIFLIAFYQKKTQRIASDFWILVVLILTFGINIINNFFRMTLLILLKIAPENPFHEIVGLICFLIYVCLPLSYFIPKVFHRISREVINTENISPVELSLSSRRKREQRINWKSWTVPSFFGRTNRKYISDYQLIKNKKSLIILHLFLSFTICFIIVSGVEKIRIQQKMESANILKQFEVEQIRTDKALIYIKKIPAFYSVEHSPLFCWRGSGYDLTNIDESTINHQKIYTGTLVKGNEKLKTAWWFTDDKILTISQLEWRWIAFKENKSFKLVNVTANSEADLESEIIKQIVR
jgi:exosortase/archaeosortase family protein